MRMEVSVAWSSWEYFYSLWTGCKSGHRRSLPRNLLAFSNNSPVPIYTSGWRETLGELSVRCPRTQLCSRPGLEPGPLASVSIMDHCISQISLQISRGWGGPFTRCQWNRNGYRDLKCRIYIHISTIVDLFSQGGIYTVRDVFSSIIFPLSHSFSQQELGW